MVKMHYSMSLQIILADCQCQSFSFLESQWEGYILCYCASNFHNASQNRYDKNNPFKLSYVSSIDKMDFMLDFKPSIDTR